VSDYKVADTNLETMTEFMDTKRIPHRILIDCTASDEVADMYQGWLKKGIHVISPNKMALTGKIDRYQKCMDEVSLSKAQWHYESTVCGQMPVINLIHDILQTGDHVKCVQGSFSGTMSFIFNTLASNPSMTFSKAVAEARAKGVMEPNCAADLSGSDLARKVLILARELGLEIEISDVKVESLLPANLESILRDDEDGFKDFVAKLGAASDEEIAKRLKDASDRGEQLHYIGEVDMETKTVSVGLKSLPSTHPLSGSKDAEMVSCWMTGRYPEATPLVVRGPGAGTVVTASGVMQDILRLSKTLGD